MEIRGGRAFTLIEMVVYMGLFSLVGLLIASIFSISRRTHDTTAAAYAVTGQTDTAIRFIREDLQETALGSLRTYTTGAGVLPAVSMVSPREMETASQPGKLLISEYGVPRWRKHIYYALRRTSASATLGDLVRWESALPASEQDRLPKLAPRPTAPSAKARVMLRNVLGANQVVNNLGGLGTYRANEWGGFRLQFVRRSGGEGGLESLSDVNPVLNLAGAGDNTRLVEVELAVTEGVTGTPNFYRIKFRVAPRY